MYGLLNCPNKHTVLLLVCVLGQFSVPYTLLHVFTVYIKNKHDKYFNTSRTRRVHSCANTINFGVFMARNGEAGLQMLVFSTGTIEHSEYLTRIIQQNLLH